MQDELYEECCNVHTREEIEHNDPRYFGAKDEIPWVTGRMKDFAQLVMQKVHVVQFGAWVAAFWGGIKTKTAGAYLGLPEMGSFEASTRGFIFQRWYNT